MSYPSSHFFAPYHVPSFHLKITHHSDIPPADSRDRHRHRHTRTHTLTHKPGIKLRYSQLFKMASRSISEKGVWSRKLPVQLRSSVFNYRWDVPIKASQPKYFIPLWLGAETGNSQLQSWIRRRGKIQQNVQSLMKDWIPIITFGNYFTLSAATSVSH